MVSATALLAVAVTGGFASTYLYDRGAPLRVRLAAGTVTGFAAFSLVGFLAAMTLGLGWPAILLTSFITLLPTAVFLGTAARLQLQSDLRRASSRWPIVFRQPRAVGLLAIGVAAAVVLWALMSRTMILDETGALATGDNHNYGDLPFHLTVVTRFVAGNNLPPEHPSFAGAPFTYPFLTDFLSGMLVTGGADLRTAIVLPAVLGVFALVLLVHQWTLELTGDILAACVAPVLLLVGGGLGWWTFVQEAWQAPGNTWTLLSALPHDYTIRSSGLRFGNVVTTLLIPQRGINLGLPLAVVVFRQWWLASRDAASKPNVATRRLVAAGTVAGLLPLVHGHTYMVVVGLAGCLALLFPMWRGWMAFMAMAIGAGIPQLLWLAKDSAVSSASFVGWSFGWDRGETGAVAFWLMNTGALIPLLMWALAARGENEVVPPMVRRFYLPFLLCFAVPNVIRLAPWVWDNIKVLVYWFLASVPLVSLVLARWYHAGSWYRALSVTLAISLTAAGTLDLWRLLSGAAELQVLSPPAAEFSTLTASTTDTNATILHAPIHNHSVVLSGRRSFMGYPGHIWSQGLDSAAREQDIRTIYAGGSDAVSLLARHHIDYVVVGVDEKRFTTVNEAFFARYPVVATVGPYRLHRVTPPSE